MSDHHKEIICPNCNHPATGNYCAECGQPTHLHNDTFIGLVSHFISHYFHFDSKFWKTIKTLIAKPGKLATAYHDKQRMRYIDPISLYIFVSLVFFIIVSFTVKFEQSTVREVDGSYTVSDNYSLGLFDKLELHHKHAWVTDYNADSLRAVKNDIDNFENQRKDYFKKHDNRFEFSSGFARTTFYNYFLIHYAYNHQIYDDDTTVNVVYNKFLQVVPKIFFLLMPLLALLLYMTFFNKRGYKFTDYAVMSLHTHVFLFISAIVLLLGVGSVTDASKNFWLIAFLVVIPLVYFIISCRNFFNKNWVYTIIAGSLTWVLYLALVLIASIITVLCIISYT